MPGGTRGRRSLVLRADGAFLLLAGGVALVLETLAHCFALGPQRELFAGRPWATIGFFEAHGLSIILGAVLLGAAAPPDRGSHRLAAGVHLLLGGANLLFSNDAFVQVGLQTVGVVTTSLHLLFGAAQGFYAWRAPAASASRVRPAPAARRSPARRHGHDDRRRHAVLPPVACAVREGGADRSVEGHGPGAADRRNGSMTTGRSTPPATAQAEPGDRPGGQGRRPDGGTRCRAACAHRS